MNCYYFKLLFVFMVHSLAYFFDKLCYMPEGRGFTILNVPHPSGRTMTLGGDSASNKCVLGIFLGVKRGQHVKLTTSPPSLSRFYINVRFSTSREPIGLHGLMQR
jgi:hypothetical protein